MDRFLLLKSNKRLVRALVLTKGDTDDVTNHILSRSSKVFYFFGRTEDNHACMKDRV